MRKKQEKHLGAEDPNASGTFSNVNPDALLPSPCSQSLQAVASAFLLHCCLYLDAQYQKASIHDGLLVVSQYGRGDAVRQTETVLT